jgi:hypothetical protein
MRRHVPSALLVALALSACASTEEAPTTDGRPKGPTGPVAIDYSSEKRVDTDFGLDWEDIERNDRGEQDPEQVAQWVVERHNAVERCLREQPQLIGQAKEILEEILSKVPDTTRDRFILAQVLFSEAAYFFRLADGAGWEMTRLREEHTGRLEEGSPKLTDEQVDARVATIREWLEAYVEQLNAHASKALAQFTLYRNQRPDDKRVYDYIWKLHFFLQNYPEAMRWLDLVLYEMDQTGIPENEPIRQDYTSLRQVIAQAIAEQRTDATFQPILPRSRTRDPFSAESTAPR